MHILFLLDCSIERDFIDCIVGLSVATTCEAVAEVKRWPIEIPYEDDSDFSWRTTDDGAGILMTATI